MDENIKKKIRELRVNNQIYTPKKGVPLFKPGTDESCVATVDPSNDIRALGFKRAADILVDMAAGNPSLADDLVYAVGFLYRMYIEVRMKTILEVANQISKSDYHHDLTKLWGKVKPIIESSSQFFDDGELEALEEKIQEFFRIDPFSDAFRYSTNKKGEPTLVGIGTMDLKHLKHVIDSLSTPLEGSYTAIYEDNRGE